MPKNEISIKQLLPLFFLSGAASLIYELSWIRESSLIFGSTLPALTTVTAIYFGGMALGSGFFSRLGIKFSGALYGKIQIGVALSGLLSVILFILFKNVTPAIYPMIQNSSLMLNIYRLIAVSTTIGIPTFLMGATFPVMMAISPVKEGREGFTVGLINGINSLGAVAGTVLTGFFLIPQIGMTGAIIIAAVINIILGIRFLKSDITVAVHAEKSVQGIKLFPALPLFFGIGFCGMASQILWSRFLSLVIHNTVYTYTITIAVVITGLSLGSIIAGHISGKTENHSRLFGGAVILNLTAMITALYLPASVWTDIAAISSPFLRMGTIAATMFLPAIFSGATFPLALKMIGGGAKIRGRNAGMLSMVNTTGGILGSLLAGFCFLPLLGTGGTLILIAVLLFVIALVTFSSGKKIGFAWLFLIIPMIPLFFLFRSPEKFILSFLSITEEKDIVSSEESKSQKKADESVVFLEEGRLSSVVVKKKGDDLIMEIDRLWQGENKKTRQIMAAHIPMLLADNAERVLVVGLGPGVTAERFTMYDIDSLDLLDIEPAVFDAAEKYFDGSWMKNEGIRSLTTDGRNYIQYSDRQYDLISIEIGQVFRPHAAGFYSEEFYKYAKARLSQNGVIGQFVPVAAFNSSSFRRVIATFLSVFPQAQLWYNQTEFLLIGFNSTANKLNSESVKRWLKEGTEVYEDLEYNYWGGSKFNLNNVNNLAAGFLVGSEDLHKLTKGFKPYFDAIPELEYSAAANEENEPFVEELYPFLTSVDSILPNLSRRTARAIEENREANLGNIFSDALLRIYYQTGNIAFLEKAYEYNKKSINVIRLLGRYHYDDKNYKQAEKYLYDAFLQDPASHGSGRQVAIIRLRNGDANGAINLLLNMLSVSEADAGTHVLLGAALLQQGNYPLAKKHTSRALELDPENAMALRNMEFINSKDVESE